MPITQSAKKALRVSLRKKAVNLKIRNHYRKLVSNFKKAPTPKKLEAAMSAVDKAAKSRVIAKNKASRLKSQLAAKLAASKKSNK